LNHIQTIAPDSNIPTTSNQQQTSITDDDSLIDQLLDHYKGELPNFVDNSEKASEIASEKVILESPHQQEPEQWPESPNSTHLESHSPKQPDFDENTLASEDQTLVVSPIIVALPTYTSVTTNDTEQNLDPK